MSKIITVDEAFELINQVAPHTLPEAGTAKEEAWILRGSPLPSRGVLILADMGYEIVK